LQKLFFILEEGQEKRPVMRQKKQKLKTLKVLFFFSFFLLIHSKIFVNL